MHCMSRVEQTVLPFPLARDTHAKLTDWASLASWLLVHPPSLFGGPAPCCHM